MFLKAKPVWIFGKKINDYLWFSQEFEGKKENAKLRISCDTNYLVYINEKFVATGQYQCVLPERSVDEIDVSEFLKGGDNIITVAVHYEGVSNFQYMAGEPFVIFEIEDLVASGEGTLVTRCNHYKTGAHTRTNMQLGFNFEFHGANESKAPDKVKVIGSFPYKFVLRPVKKLVILPKSESKMIWTNGKTALFDLGAETAGLLHIELSAKAGVVLDIGYGEHLRNGRVAIHIGERHFENRYITKEGKQEFTHFFSRIAGRYLEVTAQNAKELPEISYVGIIPTEYPIQVLPMPHLPDELHRKIYEVSVRTLSLCMHEHYEDTPWREQALYALDSRNQALCGYYAFGEYDFAGASFRLMGKCIREDGLTRLIAPSEFDLIIPSFCLSWIMEVAEYFEHSGKIDEEMINRGEFMLDLLCQNQKDGLPNVLGGENNWHFYEWSPGLANDVTGVFPSGGVDHDPKQVFHAPYILFLLWALRKLAPYSAKGDGYRKAYEKIKANFNQVFFDAEKGVYFTYFDGKNGYHYSELVQALAICSGVSENPSALREILADSENGLVKLTLSHFIYKIEALMGEPDKYTKLLYEKIATDWGAMLEKGATSFWETIKGAEDFDGAGSLCHGWSAVPIYFYHLANQEK